MLWGCICGSKFVTFVSFKSDWSWSGNQIHAVFVWCRQVRDTLQAEGLKSDSGTFSNCWSNAKRLFVNTLKHDSSGSDLRQIIRIVWEFLTEAEGEVIGQEAGLTAVLHHKSSKRLSQAVAQSAVGKKESPGSVKRRVNGLV